MDNPPRPEERYANSSCDVPSADASSQLRYSETYMAQMQTAMNDVQYLEEKESHGSASIFTFDGSANLRYDKTLGINATSKTTFHNTAVAGIDGQHIESHYDLSQITRNNSEPSPVSDVVASNSFCYTDRITATSGSSSSYRDGNSLNVAGEMSQSFNKGEIKSIICKDIKALICRICKDEIVQHETEERVLKYVDSLYYNCEENKILIHSHTHVPKTTCAICGKEHAAGNSHNSQHRCPDCPKMFQCRTQFYQHIPEHRDNYFKRNCWVCIRSYKEHIFENDSSYICCVCEFNTDFLHSLEKHNLLHLPR